MNGGCRRDRVKEWLVWCAGLVRSETAAQAHSAFLFLDRLSTIFCTFKLQLSTFSLTNLLVVSTRASWENLSTTTELDVRRNIGLGDFLVSQVVANVVGPAEPGLEA